MNAITTTAPPLAYGDLERLADSIAKSNLFGIKTKDQAIALMMIAHAEGRHPALAARDYDIIQGRPAKKAEAMMRDFLEAGGKIEWHAVTDELADATFTHPQTGSVRIDWDMKRAMTAFGKKDMYAKFPRQMLRSRVVSEGVRTLWPLATSGFHVPEEMADMKPEHNGPTLEGEPEAPAPSRRDAINLEVPLKAAAAPMPRGASVRSAPVDEAPEPPRNGSVRHSIAPPPGAPDEAWRACLDKVAPAMHRLSRLELIHEMANGPTCSDIVANGPEWAREELDQILVDNCKRFEPEAADELGEIVGEDKIFAGDD